MDQVDTKSRTLTVPSGSLLDSWRRETDGDRRKELALQIAASVKGAPPEDAATPDGILFQQLHSLSLPLDDDLLQQGVKPDRRFGVHPLGHVVERSHLVVKAPAKVAFRIPAELAAGRELVAVGMCETDHGREGTVQLNVSTSLSQPPWAARIVCAEASQARQRVEQACEDFRGLFPIALCLHAHCFRLTKW